MFKPPSNTRREPLALKMTKRPGKNRDGGANQNSPLKRRRRTADDFLTFCQMILDYENYDQTRATELLRRRHSSSPLGSTGSCNESLPPSKDELFDNESSLPDFAKSATRSYKSVSMIRQQQHLQDIEDPDDSWDQVTCFCGKPFAGRPMIECSSCLTWVHLKCAKLRRTHIPDTWHCKTCKDSSSSRPQQQQQDEQQQRVAPKVSGSRKRKSTNASRKIVVQQQET